MYCSFGFVGSTGLTRVRPSGLSLLLLLHIFFLHYNLNACKASMPTRGVLPYCVVYSVSSPLSGLFREGLMSCISKMTTVAPRASLSPRQRQSHRPADYYIDHSIGRRMDLSVTDRSINQTRIISSDRSTNQSISQPVSQSVGCSYGV